MKKSSQYKGDSINSWNHYITIGISYIIHTLQVMIVGSRSHRTYPWLPVNILQQFVQALPDFRFIVYTLV
jgi:hypothetical protein